VFVQAGWKKSDAPRALIVIVHDYNGISSYETARAHMLVMLGYVVFCVDVYGADVQATGGSKTFAQVWRGCDACVRPTSSHVRVQWVPYLLEWVTQPSAFAQRVLVSLCVVRWLRCTRM
jgi:dienelactone hydrolase